ncbi:MAG: mechanosensitive ion channel family protein [Ignavibacteriales bacterium]|nr:mechanosensitive ion channel family protein [Ignavibacteriales bacterium]
MEALRTYLGDGMLFHAVSAFLMFVAAMVLGWIAKRLLSTVGRRLAAKTASDLDDIILEIVLDRIKWIAVVAGLYLATEQLSHAANAADITAHQWLGYAQGVIFVCFVAVVTVLFIRIADTSVKYFIERHARRTSSKINEALLPLLNRLITILIVLISVITVLHHFEQDVSSLVVSLGVGSLAIALAAQETIANMIGGFVIMTDRPFRVSDRIKLPTGEIGDVQEIGIRSTRVLDFDNNLIVFPNAELIKGKIINYSYPSEHIRVFVDVSVAYGTNIDRVKAIMLRFAQEHPDVLKSPPPSVFLIGFGESSLNLQLNGRTGDYRKKFPIETSLREQIYRAFLNENIQMAIPQRVVHLTSPLNVTH